MVGRRVALGGGADISRRRKRNRPGCDSASGQRRTRRRHLLATVVGQARLQGDGQRRRCRDPVGLLLLLSADGGGALKSRWGRRGCKATSRGGGVGIRLVCCCCCRRTEEALSGRGASAVGDAKVSFSEFGVVRRRAPTASPSMTGRRVAPPRPRRPCLQPTPSASPLPRRLPGRRRCPAAPPQQRLHWTSSASHGVRDVAAPCSACARACSLPGLSHSPLSVFLSLDLRGN